MTGVRSLRGVLEWGVASRPFPGEEVCGDRHAVVPRERGALIAVIDALGHGVAAEATAKKAATILEGYAHEPLPILIQRCHDALLGDRGVVMSMAAIDGQRGTMAWAGVGNVAAVLLRSAAGRRVRRERLIQPAGIIGAQLPVLRTTVLKIAPGDLLMFATDGVHDGFGEEVSPRGGDLQDMAERLVLEHASSTDDAMVLVVRYLGGS